MTALSISLAIFSILLLIITLISLKLNMNLIINKNKLEKQIIYDKQMYQKQLKQQEQKNQYEISKVAKSFEGKLRLLQNTSSDKVLSASQKDIISFLIPFEELKNPYNSDLNQKYIVEEKLKYLKKKRIAGEFSFSGIHISTGQIKETVYKELLDFLIKENFIYYKIEDANSPFYEDKIVTFYFNYYSE